MATAGETISVEQLRAGIEADIRSTYEAKFVRDIGIFREKMRLENDQALQKVIEEFKASQKPPSEEDVRKLLSQEYLTFEVVLPWEDETETSTAQTRTFVIRELPQSVEKKFYRQFKEQLIPRASEIGGLAFAEVDGDVAKRLKSILEAIDPAFDLMAEAVTMILNPRGKDKIVTKDWIQDNISSYRQWNIIYAQIQINRLRDFFSQISRGSKGMTILGAAPTQN
jgi:hypothetical protein